MAWRWTYQDDDGVDVTGPDETFEDQEQAEAWLSDTWADLAEIDVTQVSLLDGDTVIYGPMSLKPA
jgi:predicted NUDIX family NTP pyrophosphohydrolase